MNDILGAIPPLSGPSQFHISKTKTSTAQSEPNDFQKLLAVEKI
ncbi:MAG: hypothetical protein QNJ58_15890 [Desulfobacterales bacterium]|nr:hypothetical protein [Desulfobacterales bacterium]